MNDDIDDILQDDAAIGEFEGELYLSTDGKNTVHVKARTQEGRKAALKWAKLVYEGIKSTYGTKQQLNVEAYNKEEDLGVCPKCGAPNAKSMKGKIYCSAKCWLKNQ
jgi:hypothetical protein